MTVNETFWGGDHPKSPVCTRCGIYPIALKDMGICGACIGRDLLGFRTRDEHTAFVRTEYEKAQARKRTDPAQNN